MPLPVYTSSLNKIKKNSICLCVCQYLSNKMGLMWICLRDLTMYLRKFTEAKWQKVQKKNNLSIWILHIALHFWFFVPKCYIFPNFRVWPSDWISKNKTLNWKNQSEWKKSEIKKNEAGWPIYLLKNIIYNSLHKNKFLILSYSFSLMKLWRTYLKTLLSVFFNICKEMGLMWICLWDLTVSLRKFTEAKWENVRNIHNNPGGFLLSVSQI